MIMGSRLHMSRVLVCGPNWLGDSVMSMPALQRLKARYPAARLTLCVKPGLAPLWEMHEAVDDVVPLGDGFSGAMRAARAVRARGVRRALVFPNSFRSALIPFAARVPERVGMRGHQRAWMLTDVTPAPVADARRHQAWEYMTIAGLKDEETLDDPRLRVPRTLRDACRARFGLSEERVWTALIPGAAYGPSKRWPPEHFAAVGRRLRDARDAGVVVLGSDAEAPLCRRVAEETGGAALNLAGRTSLPEVTAVLSLCRCVVGNDSGGTHLATAVGARVVTIFGITDPERTGPLGAGHRVIGPEGGRRSRDIPRDSDEARARLAAIAPERVWEAVRELYGGG